jgi:hypothetical protein
MRIFVIYLISISFFIELNGYVFGESLIDPVQVNVNLKHSEDFMKMLEKQFTVGDRLLMPLGVYAVSNYIRNKEEMERLSANDITFIQRYTGKELTVDRSREDIRDAKKAGIAMAYSLPTRAFHEDKEWWRTFVTERDLINQDQIVFWYLHGEPKLEDVHYLKTVADLLHEMDVHHRPVLSYHNDIDKVTKQMSSFLDALVFGAYPGVSKEKGLSRVRIAYYIQAAHSYNTNVIAALEAYKTPSGWPRPEELKFDAYLSLIYGAKGIMWYCYYQLREKPELLDTVFEISRLLNGPEFLGEVFLRGKDNHSIQATLRSGPATFMDGFTAGMKRNMPDNPSLHWRAIDYKDNTYLVMVNTCEVVKRPDKNIEQLTIDLEFRGFEGKSKIALLDGENNYQWDGKGFRVCLPPLGISILKVRRPLD